MKKRNMLAARIATITLLGTFVSSCAAGFGETRYMMTTNPDTGEVVNVFRLKVSGHAKFSNMRYLSGYYDERAVDLFFNEVKSTTYEYTEDEYAGFGPIFDTACASGELAKCKKARDNKLALVPIGENPSGDYGSFVMILSTDADAISDTIGAIAQDDIMKQSLFRLANKDKLRQQANLTALSGTKAKQRAAIVTELDALFAGQLVKNGTTYPDKNDYLAVLSTLARGVSANAPARFVDFNHAESWFKAHE